MSKKKIFLKVIVVILMLSVCHSALAQRSGNKRTRSLPPTADTKYEEPDTGRYWVDNVQRKEIDTLNNEPAVSNLRIPVLLGVKVSNLTDTWGDARSNGRTHEGIDILSPRGDPIVSPTDAVVTTVTNGGLGGNHVWTSNPGGERFYFAHLDSFAEGLREGQVLESGDLIGYVGNTGNAAGGVTHLHFGIYEDDRGGAVNPFPRLTLVFSLKDVINAVKNFLNISDSAGTLARSLTGLYRSTFTEAQASGITLPSVITQALAEKTTEVLGITRTLQLGSSGDDVRQLQGALGLSADGVFGPQTKAAVIAFQISKGLTADGVFGPKSRALLGNSGAVNIPTGADCTPTGPICPNGKTFSSNCKTSC